MAAKVRGKKATWLRLALALPLAGLVVPIGLAGPGAAAAATVKKVARSKAKTRKPAQAKRVCTVTRVKGRKVTRCKTVNLPPPPWRNIPPPKHVIVPPPQYPPMIYPAATPLAAAPAPISVPPLYAASPQVNPADYYWIDQADSLAQAFGNSPPDFTFTCDGVDCWAWVSRDGEVLIVEPGRSGVQQYFFAANQSAPYLVRDSYNAFAFGGRELAVVYNREGQVSPYSASPRDRDVADALRERGRALYAASLRQRRWDRGSATAWIGGYSSLGYDHGWNYGWNPFWRELPTWDRYDRGHHRNHPPRHLDDEHRDRDDARRRYDDWHRRGGEGAPPPTGNPVVTPTDDGAPGAKPRPGWRPRPVAPPQPPATDPATGGPVAAPTDGSGSPSAPRPPRQPRPEPQPQPQPELQPVPPVLVAPLQPETAPPEPSPPPAPRRDRPRREIEPEPGAPPIQMRPTAPQPQPVALPVTQIEARPAPRPIEQYTAPPPPPPAPAPVHASVPLPPPAPAPAPVYAAAPPPPSPPPAPPPREELRFENPVDGGERP